MNGVPVTALLAALSFLMGSVPFGVIVARARGVDLRKVGSGNIGATNVLRALGKGPALFTLAGDMLKGAGAVALGRVLGLDPLGYGLMGLGAVLGHNYSVFTGFKGGKGVATGIGVALVYVPPAGLASVAVWLVTAFLTRYSSLGAVAAFATFAPLVYFMGGTGHEALVSAAVSCLILFKHSGNIIRLVKGTERRIGERA